MRAASPRSIFAAVIVVIIIGLPLLAAAGSVVQGEASGVAARTARGVIENVPEVVLPEEGGHVQETSSAIVLPEIMSVGAVSVVTTGSVNATRVDSQSIATVQDVNLFGGLVTVKRVVAVSRSRGDEHSASSTSTGSMFVGLVVDGVALGDVTPAENTRIELPGVGTVILNEQVPRGNGWRSSGLTVNMIRLVIEDGQRGEIIVGSVQSAVVISPSKRAAGLRAAR